MKELLNPFADRYFFNGVIAGTMLTLIILVLVISWVTGNWSLLNIAFIISFVFLTTIALKASSNMYEERK